MGLAQRYGVGPPFVPWYKLIEHTGEAVTFNANPYELHDFVFLNANTVVNLPPGSIAMTGKYVGVQMDVNLLANGFTVTVKADGGATTVEVLYTEGQVVWFGYDDQSGAWSVIAREDPAPNFGVRFSPFAAYTMDGANADLTDQSGNGRTLTKAGTIFAANGMRAGFQSSLLGASQGWTRSDANFRIVGDLSIELLVKPVGNAINGAGGFYVQMGTGTGGAANNRVFAIGVNAVNASLSLVRNGLYFQSMHGPNTADNVLSNVAANVAWTHIVVTRGADHGGTQPVFIYVNGLLTNSAPITTTDSSTTTAFALGTNVTGDGKLCNLYTSILTSAQIAYLARLRLGRAWRT